MEISVMFTVYNFNDNNIAGELKLGTTRFVRDENSELHIIDQASIQMTAKEAKDLIEKLQEALDELA